MNTIVIGISVLIAASVPISWLVSEVRDAPKVIRIPVGLGVMLLLLCVPFVMNDVHVVRQRQYDGCITRIAQLLDQGDQETVKRAMAAWNKDRGETTIGNLDHLNAILDKDTKVK